MKKPSLPPGLPFLFRILLALSASPLLTFAAAHALTRYAGIDLPAWLVVVTAVLSGPILFAARVWHRYRGYELAAARNRAVLPPEIMPEWKWAGNLPFLRASMKAFSNGYISDLANLGVTNPTSAFQFSILWGLAYQTYDPKIIKAVLATEFSNYEKGEVFRGYLNSLIGTGVFNSDGEMWKFHRSIARPYFSRDRISHFDIFDAHSERAIEQMKERFRAGVALDFQELVSRFTLDSATEFLFGTCVNSLESALPYPHNASPFQNGREVLSAAEKFARAFSTAQRVAAQRPRLGPLWPLAEFWRSKTDEPMAVIDAFLEPIIQEALRKHEKRTAEEKRADAPAADSETLLDNLVRATTDRTILHDETLNILIAGRDTTAATLTFAVYLLAQHPAVLKRLRAEILEHVGPSRRPTYDNIRNMKYLRSVINETMRLYPAVPMNVRFAIKDALLPNPDPHGQPFFIPAGAPVGYSVLNMHRAQEYWGPTADEYDPERWIDERVAKYLVANPFIFLPFNGGPRICLGQQFAYNEMSFFLIRLLQSFSTIELDLAAQPPEARPPPEWKNAPGRKGVEQVVPKLHLTIYVQGGLWVKMGEAVEAAA